MNTILFTWNPKKWPWDDLSHAVAEANVEGRHIDRWSCGVTKKIALGDRAFLMRLGMSPKGIMGSGVVVTEPEEGSHWDSEKAAQGAKGFYVGILFDMLSETPLLGEDVLSSPMFAGHNWYPQPSGTFIPSDVAMQLESLWSKKTKTKFVPPSAEELPTLHLEGTRRTRLITASERNPEARAGCIKYYGTKCQVCDLAFEERYGDIGKGFIHVHHIMPMAEIGTEYEIDPVQSLRPVCPNCHAMLHKRTPPYSILELREIIQASNRI